ncbi:MAG: SdpI family protein [Acidobacteriota bacterium]
MSAIQIIVAVSNFFCAILVSAISWPMVRRRVKPNRLYGFRIAKAFESEENWYAINAWGGRQMILWSLPVALAGVLALTPIVGDSEMRVLIAGLTPLLYIIPCIAGWLYARSL